jgi:D-amino-acid dehydrogenase
MTRVNAIVRTAKRVLPQLDLRVRHVWRGLRPCSPDGLPLIGPLDGLERVVLATGHAMLGLTLAPLTGRLVAELITGLPPTVDLKPLSPVRFHSAVSNRITSA